MSELAKCVYRFGMDASGFDVTEGSASMSSILGGKGANLAEMCRIGLPVPPGFTVSCSVCTDFTKGKLNWLDVKDDVWNSLSDLEERMGKKLGDAQDPLLVSVRSGAPISMPGMMDTILNLGMNDQSVLGLIDQTQNERFGWDSYRRFIQMFSNVVMGIDSDLFENVLTKKRLKRGVKDDSELSVDDLKDTVAQFKAIFRDNVDPQIHPEVVIDGEVEFPQDSKLQLQLAICAVFASWNNSRARLYRKRNEISDDLGTAVNVQAMVFGNKGNTSATGVAFTRNPANGDKSFYGDFLVNAQGEDVVAGIRNTQPLDELKDIDAFKHVSQELEEIFVLLENHYRDMCDIEYTIEQGKLWMLQTRVGKRTAQAALKIAMDMCEEGLISKEEALLRVDPAQIDMLLHPQINPDAQINVLCRGLNASPGAAVGEVVFTSDDAVELTAQGRPCVLVRWETNPDDLKGMIAAEGILTSHGGKTSHAAVIARGMGKPCVCGCEALKIDASQKVVKVHGTDITIHEGDIISIDGTDGIVVLGEVDLIQPKVCGSLDTFLGWADDVRYDETKGRVIGVRANADNPEDAQLSLDFGAEALGLCRTEHMFLGDRKRIIQDFILGESQEIKERALSDLLKVQTDDFYEMFKIMDAKEVIVRLLDPPLHEFVDDPRDLAVELAHLEEQEVEASVLKEKKALLRAIDSMAEVNPMLGLRGCRLAIVHPELLDMQVYAIATATARLVKEGLEPCPEIMIPLVSVSEELKILRGRCENIIAKVEQEFGVELHIPIGTMIELPRACVCSADIAQYADFFSFGTNDLTQTTFGFSRDDVESAFVPTYLRQGFLQKNPFETLDAGVNELVKLAISGGRSTKSDLTCGVCGETGGDPTSINTLYNDGVSYVSCSPYRVPIARLSAAQAKLRAQM